MKKFIYHIFFFLLPLSAIFLLGLFAPTTPYASNSLLMASTKKELLLQKTPSPRIIFVGGSNLSFGLNSQLIKDSLKLNPINTAIHASIGIKYMIDNTLEYIQKGDIVVIIPEYLHYYCSLYSGSEELMRIIFDVKKENIKYLHLYQVYNILPFLPKYTLTKFKLSEYLALKENTTTDVYSVNSFNEYGDTYVHWTMKRKDFSSYQTLKGEFNPEVLDYFELFNLALKKKGAHLLVSFPPFETSSYNNSIKQIAKIEEELKKTSLMVIGSAERYKMPDSLTFNEPYHLIKPGVDYRTNLFIEDFNKARINNNVYVQ